MDTRNGFPMFVEYQSISRFNDNVIPNQSVTNQVVSFFFFCFRFIDRNYLYLCEKFVIRFKFYSTNDSMSILFISETFLQCYFCNTIKIYVIIY